VRDRARFETVDGEAEAMAAVEASAIWATLPAVAADNARLP
jgi:hypothetical protein